MIFTFRLYFIIAWFIVSISLTVTAQSKTPQPIPAQLAWQEAELGVVFHYDLHVFDGKKYRQWENRITPVEDYNIFNPEQLDTDQWIKAAKEMGARFAILTATHETGFALYPSDVNPYSVKALKWRDGKGDIVADFVASCRKYDIKPGIYIGIRWNSFFGVHNFKVNGTGDFQKNRQIYYNRMVEGMVTEICMRYGDLFEIWFDGGADHPDRGAPDVLPIVKKYQPNYLFYHNAQLAEARWGGSESGTVAYPCWATFPHQSTDATFYPDIPENNFQLLKTGDPDGAYWMPAMSDAPLRGYNGRHEWFWEPDDEAHVYPLENLVDMYYESVGRNSTLIIGLTPDPRGLMPDVDVERMREFGREIDRRFSRPLASARGGNVVTVVLQQPTTVNHIIMQENIINGEHVRSYLLEAKVNGVWQKIAKGSCIGHKRIQSFEKVTTTALRLSCTTNGKEAEIKNMSVYFVDDSADSGR